MEKVIYRDNIKYLFDISVEKHEDKTPYSFLEWKEYNVNAYSIEGINVENIISIKVYTKKTAKRIFKLLTSEEVFESLILKIGTNTSENDIDEYQKTLEEKKMELEKLQEKVKKG